MLIACMNAIDDDPRAIPVAWPCTHSKFSSLSEIEFELVAARRFFRIENRLHVLTAQNTDFRSKVLRQVESADHRFSASQRQPEYLLRHSVALVPQAT
jgi:hypothetical protein